MFCNYVGSGTIPLMENLQLQKEKHYTQGVFQKRQLCELFDNLLSIIEITLNPTFTTYIHGYYMTKVRSNIRVYSLKCFNTV